MTYLDKALSWEDFNNSEKNWKELLINTKRFTDFLTEEQMVKNAITRRFQLLCSQVNGIESLDVDQQESIHGQVIDLSNDIYNIINSDNDFVPDENKSAELKSDSDLFDFNWDECFKMLQGLISVIIHALLQFLSPVLSMVQKVISAVQKVDPSGIDPLKADSLFSERASKMFAEYIPPARNNAHAFEMHG